MIRRHLHLAQRIVFRPVFHLRFSSVSLLRPESRSIRRPFRPPIPDSCASRGSFLSYYSTNLPAWKPQTAAKEKERLQSGFGAAANPLQHLLQIHFNTYFKSTSTLTSNPLQHLLQIHFNIYFKSTSTLTSNPLQHLLQIHFNTYFK
jgi:hypothetical protein